MGVEGLKRRGDTDVWTSKEHEVLSVPSNRNVVRDEVG